MRVTRDLLKWIFRSRDSLRARRLSHANDLDLFKPTLCDVEFEINSHFGRRVLERFRICFDYALAEGKIMLFSVSSIRAEPRFDLLGCILCILRFVALPGRKLWGGEVYNSLLFPQFSLNPAGTSNRYDSFCVYMYICIYTQAGARAYMRWCATSSYLNWHALRKTFLPLTPSLIYNNFFL